MIYLILILGLVLRLIQINQSLWFDESINILAARDLPFWQFVSSYPIGDFHPPGYFAILWLWGHLFGFSEISVRLPSVIFGVGTIYLTYLLAKKLFGKQAAIFASLLLAAGPLHVYYSQEARMYVFAAFAATLSFYSFIKLTDESKFKDICFYAGSLILLLYSDYVALLVLPAQFIYLAIFRRSKIKHFLQALALGLIAFIPWLVFVFPSQLQNGIETSKNVPGWKAVVGGGDLKNVSLVLVKTLIGRVSFERKQLYGLILIIFSVGYLIALVKALKTTNKKIWLFILWLMIPLVLAFLISYITPILAYFRMLFILPAFYILVGLGISKYSKEVRFLLLGLLVLLSMFALSFYYTNPQFQRENWKGASRFLEQKSTDKTMVLFENDNLPAPFRYYQTKVINSEGALKHFPATTIEDLKPIDTLTNDKNTVYLVEYLVDISDKQRLVRLELIKDGFKLKHTYNFEGVGFIYEYTKKN